MVSLCVYVCVCVGGGGDKLTGGDKFSGGGLTGNDGVCKWSGYCSKTRSANQTVHTYIKYSTVQLPLPEQLLL